MSPPPQHEAVASCVVSVRLTPDEYRAVRSLAKVERMTVSALISEALAELAGDLGERRPVAWRAQSCLRCRYRPHRRA